MSALKAFFVALAIFLLLGCAQHNPQNPNDITSFKVTYQEHAGMLVGVYTKITVESDGLAIKEERKYRAQLEVKNITLNETELADFKKMLAEADVFSYANRYDCYHQFPFACMTDQSGYSVQFVINSKEKNVSIYGTEPPQSLVGIMKKMQEIGDKVG